jgi:hypothetical protein
MKGKHVEEQMAEKDKFEKMSGITDMVEFLKAHMELTEQINDLEERIQERSKLKLHDLVEIEAYLEQKKKRKTAQDKIDYLYNMDPNSFDEELVRLGVKTMGDVEAVCDMFRQMHDIAGNFASKLGESGVLDRLSPSLSVAFNALKINPTLLMGMSISTAAFAQTVQSAEFMSAIQKAFAPTAQSAAYMSAIQKAFAPTAQSAAYMSAIQKLFASIQPQIEPLRPLIEAFDRICGSKRSRVYHRSICPHVRRIEPAKLIIFDSAKEAKAAAYSPCKFCGPL